MLKFFLTSCSWPNELNARLRRAAEPLHGDYTSSAPPGQLRLIDTLFNLQGTRGEARGRWDGGGEEIETGSVSFILVIKVFVEKGG